MTTSALAPPNHIAISISGSPDMAYLGFSEGHLWDTRAEFAIQLLASGATLAYSGDLRAHGFTEFLFEMVLRYRPTGDTRPRVKNYLAWPVHASLPLEHIESLAEELKWYGELLLVTLDGTHTPAATHRIEPDDSVGAEQWQAGLTAMRDLVRRETDARIVMGGRVEGHKGAMPDIAEEALLSLQNGQPLFLIGGFGGCAHDIAETLGLAGCLFGLQRAWPGRSEFERYAGQGLRNGLDDEQNRLLAVTPHIEQQIVLTMTGLHRLRGSASPTRLHSLDKPA